MAYKWQRSDAVVAQRIACYQIGGFLSKKILVGPDESAILEEDGNPLKIFDKGGYGVCSRMSAAGKELVWFDKRPKNLRREIEGLWTKEDKKVTAVVDLKIALSDAEKMRKFMMGSRNIITLEDIWNEVEADVVSGLLKPKIKSARIDRVMGEEKTQEIKAGIDVILRKKNELMGIGIVSVEIGWKLSGETEQYLGKRGVAKEIIEEETISEEADTMKALHRHEVGEILGEVDDREKAIGEMESERVRREAKIELEKEESQEDLREAMEAIKLKKIKDKAGVMSDMERKRLGLGAGQDSGKGGREGAK